MFAFRNLWPRVGLAAWLVLSPMAAAAYNSGENDVLLSAMDQRALTPAALAVYVKAERAYDRIDRDAGVEFLSEAARLAPDSMPLQFTLAQRARQRARFYSGRKALDFYDIAEEAVQRVLRSPDLQLEERRRAEELLQSISGERENLSARDRRNQEVGFKAIVYPTAAYRVLVRVRDMKEKPPGVAEVTTLLMDRLKSMRDSDHAGNIDRAAFLELMRVCGLLSPGTSLEQGVITGSTTTPGAKQAERSAAAGVGATPR